MRICGAVLLGNSEATNNKGKLTSPALSPKLKESSSSLI